MGVDCSTAVGKVLGVNPLPVSASWDTGEMRRRTSSDRDDGQQLCPSPCQPCSCPPQHSDPRTLRFPCRCRCRRPVVVWIALTAALLGCCVVADTSLVLPPTSSPPSATRDTEVNSRAAGARLASGLLLSSTPPSSRTSADVKDDNNELFAEEDDSDDERYRNRQSSNATTKMSTDTAVRRRPISRLNSDFLLRRHFF